MTDTITPLPESETPGEDPPSKEGRRRLRGAGVGLVVPVLALALWEVGALVGVVSTRLIPPPSQIGATLVDLAVDGDLWTHSLATTLRVLAGFVLGAVGGTILGAATGVSERFQSLFDPALQALRNIPSIAWTPLFILWFGIFETSKVLMIALGVFFPVYLTFSGAIATVDRGLVEVGRAYGFSSARLIRRILFPASLPTYVIGLRNGLGLGWMFVVAAEFLGASEGLGYLLVDGQQTGRPAIIISAIFMFALLGKVTDRLLTSVGVRFTYWQDGFTRRGATA
ncbi:MAG TPA: ABC transporter permease [Acidimicrobiia bacterium]|nr:ABC transporter permease [Acidimicrobiia bacterium]